MIGMDGRRSAADDRHRILIDERDHLLASLRDLDAELAAGDLDPADHAALYDRYTARAAAVLRALDTLTEPDPAAVSSPSSPASPASALSAPPAPPARPAGLPVRSRPRARLVATVAVVGLAAAGAGWAMAQAAGERLPGQQVSGDIVRSSGDRISQAQALAADGKLLDAIKTYDEVLRVDPDNPVALAQRGWLVSRAGLADEGLKTIDRAIEVDPRYPDAWFFKAMIHWRLKGEPDQARAAFERLLALDPPPELADFVRNQALPQLQG